MPKIVDHDAYRKELARKAADVFTRHGYSALGIRKIADELGISKSLLYHYFDGKEDLFAASTEEVLARDTGGEMPELIEQQTSPEERLNALFSAYLQMEQHFEGELSLMLDYLRGRDPSDVANDPNMQKAMKSHKQLVEKAVGSKHADTVLCCMYGLLLVRYFDGKSTDAKKVKEQLQGLLLENI
jgi:TetR/AcrR family transcriptional regulator, transcriptional repressor of aconitase